jgi:hypothetical protein
MFLISQPSRRLLVFLALVLLSLPASAAPVWSDLGAELGNGALHWLMLLPAGQAKLHCAVDAKGKMVCTPSAVNPSGKQGPREVTPKHGCGIDPSGILVCTP